MSSHCSWSPPRPGPDAVVPRPGHESNPSSTGRSSVHRSAIGPSGTPARARRSAHVRCPCRPPAAEPLCGLSRSAWATLRPLPDGAGPPAPAPARPRSAGPAGAGRRRDVRRVGPSCRAGLQGTIPARPRPRAGGGPGRCGLRGAAWPSPASGGRRPGAGAVSGVGGPPAGRPARRPVGRGGGPGPAVRRRQGERGARPPAPTRTLGHCEADGRRAEPSRGRQVRGRPAPRAEGGSGPRALGGRRRRRDDGQHAGRGLPRVAGRRDDRGCCGRRRGHPALARSAPRRARTVTSSDA